MSAMSEATEIAEKTPGSIEWAKQADDADTAELVHKFAERVNSRARTRSARVADMAARHLCEGFNHYDGARRMRACDVCVGAVRMAMVLEGD